MANAVEKKDKPGFGTRVVNGFKGIGRFFKNMWHELKKVTWPTKANYLKYLAIVLIFMVFMGVVIGLLDMGASKLVSALSSLNPNNTAEVVTDDAAPNDDATVTEPADGETVQDTTAADSTETAGN